MIKYTIILINMLALIFVRTFFTGDVNVKMKLAPDHLKKGDALTVSFTISKGSVTGVGHMKQELPAVFGNATVIDAKGGEFKYLPEDNVVKFTWISLPADQEFVVSYKVIVNPDAPDGKVNIGGKFSYVMNNEKQTSIVPEVSVLIGEENLASNITTATTTTTLPESTSTAVSTTKTETTSITNTQPETTKTETTTLTANSTQAETKTETTANTPVTEEKIPGNVSANRTIVGSPEAGTEFTVEVGVKKDGIKGFARIQETLPAGLTAMSLDNKGGTFSFTDQKVKIIWDNLPADENIKISYRVMVSENTSGDMAINGTFSYVENDDPKKLEIASTNISVKAKTAIAAIENTTTTENTNTTTTAVNTSATTNENKNTPPATTNVPDNGSTTTATTQNTTTAVKSSVPAPDNAVTYKVQICALSKTQRGTSYFESKFAIKDKVNMEFHEGWKKYIVGKYDQYKNARDFRETIRSKGVENPFVIAYNNGKRITVQEALMVSSQQWIR